MSTDLGIRLLGDVRVARGDHEIPIASPRLQTLLAYLILNRDAPQQRRRVAFLFWPDSTEQQALTNLRQLLHHLRGTLPDADLLIRADRTTVQWDARRPAHIDVVEAEAAWAAAAAVAGDGLDAAIEQAEKAAALHRGPLLPACYDAWVEPHRDRLHRTHLDGLERLVEWLESRRQFSGAAGHAARLVALDPLRESSHRALIRLHAAAGEPALALRAYEECAAGLRRELGIEPSEETESLRDAVRRGAALPGAAEGGQGAAEGAANPTGAPRTSLPLIGRHREWGVLREIWETAAASRPRVALITGEAGIGKTRLAEAVVEWASRQGAAAVRARCWAAEGLLPFGPVAQWLRAPPLRDAAADLSDVWAREVARLLPDVAPGAGEEPAGPLEPWRRIRLFEGLARAALAVERPLLLFLDDLQWCDGDTLEWLHYLLRFEETAPLLVLATRRSGEPGVDGRLDSWLLEVRRAGLLQSLDTGPLEPEDTAALASAIAERELSTPEARALHNETGGNPLFVLERVRSELDRGGCGSDASVGTGRRPTLPRSDVETVIRGRLETLSPPARELVRFLATIGRDFDLALLRGVDDRPLDDLAAALDELVRRHLVRESGGTFDFVHDRIREVAYGGIGQARRAVLHERVARAIAAANGTDPEPVAGEVAGHLERAGRPEEAIPWYRRASGRSLALYANREAADHLGRAIELLRRLPESRANLELELELQTALGVPLVAMHHYSGSRVWQTYHRARALADRVGRRPGAPVLRALSLASLMRSELDVVLDLGRELVAEAEHEGDPMLQVEADYVMGVALYWTGRIPAAASHLARAVERYDPVRAREHLALFTQDPSVICGVRLALAEWHLGQADVAHDRCLATLRRAERIGHPFSLAYARLFGGWVLVECGDESALRRHVPALLRESERHGMAVWPAMAGILEGWLMTRDGATERGIQRMLDAAGAFREQEVDLGFPYHQALLARAYRAADLPGEALAAVDEGLAMADRTGERFWDADLLRLRGELVRAAGAGGPEVDRWFDRAVRVARSQGAVALERRAERSWNADGTERRVSLPQPGAGAAAVVAARGPDRPYRSNRRFGMDDVTIRTMGGGEARISGGELDRLSDGFSGSILGPEATGYDEARSIWNGMIDRRPGLIVRCAGATDVVRAVGFARDHDLLLSVRGGGHNIAGNAVCEGGLMISLDAMKHVDVDPGTRTARVEAGATLGEVDAATQEHGLATPLGINSTTGIAGMTLGGGFGWLTRKHGMTVDNLRAVSLVTPDGELLQVSDEENEELFWALRGGGGNFGIATAFEYDLHPVGPEVLSGLIVHPGEAAGETLRFLREFVERLPDETTVWPVLRKAPPLPFLPEEWHGRDILVLAVFHAGDMEEGRELLEPIRAFGDPIADVVGPHPYAGWQQTFDPLLTPGLRNYWKSHDLAALSDDVIDHVVDFARRVPSPHCEILIPQMGGAVARVPADATAYPHRDSRFIVNVHTRWEDPAADDTCIGWARELFDALTPHATGNVYVNFMPEDETDRVRTGAYAGNYARLARIKARVDPDNVFRMNQNIRPAVPAG